MLAFRRGFLAGIVVSFLICLFPFYLYAQKGPDALVLYREGRYKEAASVCFEEIKRMPRNIDSYVVLAWALLADERYQEAADWTVKGRNEESLRLFEDYIAYAPNGTKVSGVYYHIGELYLRMAKYRHADIAFSTAIRLEPLNSLWWTRLAYSREQAKEYRAALEAYSSALQLNKNSTDAQKGYERVLHRF